MTGRLHGRIGRWLRGGAVVLVCTLAMWIVCAVALYIYAGEGRDAQRHDLVIAAGTDELVAAGQNPLEIPSHWSLRSGDVLVLDNREDSQQVFGAWSVGPGERREVVLRPFTGLVQCTLHPDGELTLEIAPDTTDWKLGLIATLAFGPTLGFGALLIARIMGALHTPAEGQRREKWPPVRATRPLLLAVAALTVAGTATTVVLMRPWQSHTSATLNGFIENPVRDVSGLALPDAGSALDASFITQDDSLLLVFFGYTSCPDVCPTTLTDLARAVDSLDPALAGRVQVAMVSVDPRRDGADTITDYVQHFHPGWSALRTDDRTLLDEVVNGFGAAYEYGEADADGTYEVAHTAFIYGIDDTGHAVVQWPSTLGADKIAADLRLLLLASQEAGA